MRRTHLVRPHQSIIDCWEVKLTQEQVTLIDTKYLKSVCEYGSPAWIASWDKEIESFYALRKIRIDGKQVMQKLHRLIARLEGWDMSLQIDHIHHNTLDNRLIELRPVTCSQNLMNQRMHRGNTSGFKGVYWNKARQKWRAQIKHDGLVRHLGFFTTPEAASEVYKQVAQQLFGEFAYT